MSCHCEGVQIYAFKVLTTDAVRIRVSPCAGFIPPGCRELVHVALLEQIDMMLKLMVVPVRTAGDVDAIALCFESDLVQEHMYYIEGGAGRAECSCTIQ